jgi:hemolysin activation/secretion protein
MRSSAKRLWPTFGLRGATLGGILLLIASAVFGADESASFDILEYRILGNSVLPVKTIERAVMPYLGPHRTIKDVEKARSDLEAAYHSAGYGTVYVDIPEQRVAADGVVRLRVTQGRLKSATITGAHYFSERQIKAQVTEAKQGAVPQLPLLQRQVAEVNSQSQDLTVVPVLKAGPVPGTVDLALRVQDSLPFHGSVELNNQRTPDTAPNRLLGTLSYGNMFGRLDTLSMQYETSPGEGGQVGVFAANYAAHVDDSGDQLAFYVLHSNSDIAVLGGLAVLGAGTVYGLRWITPLTRESSLLQTLTLGFDYKDYSQTAQTSGGAGLSTPVHYSNLSVGFGEGRTLGLAQLQWSMTANYGPRGLPNDEIEFADKRYQAQANYFYIRGDSALTLTLPHAWQIILQLDGQWATEPLISNEEFSIGGAASVRGYLETEALGDYGVRGSVQFQSPQLRIGKAFGLLGFVFADAARADILDPLPSDMPGTSLRSAGAGLSFTALKCISGKLTWADPLIGAVYTVAKQGRWLFDARCAW